MRLENETLEMGQWKELQGELVKWVHQTRNFTALGHVATYIPQLSLVNSQKVGIGIYTVDNQYFEAGDSDEVYSIQSVGKVFSLICALQDNGLDVFRMKVDVEPSGDPFNSLVKLETMDRHKPLNPFINAGAIATIGMILGKNGEERFDKVMALIRNMTNNQSIDYDLDIYNSEKETGNTNRAIAYFLKGAGIIESHVDDILETYFKMCSVMVTVKDMATAAAVIANDGVLPWNGTRLIEKEIIKTLRALMCTSGLYDGSGDFSVRVGYPAKSGVGGCIMGAVPSKLGVATFGPSLDDKGNSVAGVQLHEKLSSKYELSIF